MVLDEANGIQPERREYAPFGEMMTAEPANPTTHEFTGHQRDHAVALDYMQARYYQPRTARFTRPDPGQAFDPINPFSYNLYNYAYNNPVNLADPTGAHPVVVGILIAAKAVDVGFTVYSIYQDVQAIWRGETTAAAVLEEKGVEYAIGLGIHSGARAAYKLGKGPFKWLKGLLNGKKPDPPPKLRNGNLRFKSFTERNFCENLSILTGEIPKDSHAHHVFPQALKGRFRDIGIDINDPRYGSWWQKRDHRKHAKEYNRRWEDFLECRPSKDRVKDFARNLGGEFGFNINF